MRHFRSFLLLFVLALFSHSAPLFSKDHNKRKPTPPPPAPITQLAEYAGPMSQSEKQLVEHVKQSIARAENRNSKLSRAVLQISGMSSPKVRHLLNNLCSLPSTVYLEIGCWQGSTWIASLFGNEASISAATAIDNWSGFGGPQQQFLQNCRTFLPSLDYKLFSEDSFKLNPHSVINRPVTIYFYDGDHSAESQELAFTHYNPILDNLFIAIVDDWNWSSVQQGTREAFSKLGYEVLFEAVLPAQETGDIVNWWNGLFVAVIRKP